MSAGADMNKYAGAILGTLTLAMGLNLFSGALIAPKHADKPGWDLPGAAAPKDAPKAGAAEAAVEPIDKRLASADAKKGESVAKQCNACHTFDKGGAVKTGPNLHGVAGRQAGSVAGFSYSDGVKGLGKPWGNDLLDAFLTNPKAVAAGNKMAFAGIKDPGQRADLIAYLNSLK